MNARPRLKAYSPFAEWLLLAAALLVLGSLIGWNLYAEHNSIDARERERLMIQAAIVEKNVAPQLLLANRVIEGILKELPSWQAEQDGFKRANRELQVINDAMTGIRPILVIQADGKVLASSNETLIGMNFAHREYFKTALSNPDPGLLHVSAPFKTVLDTFVISLFRSIRGPQGEFGGIVIVSAVPEYFSILLDSVRYAPDVRAGIVHGGGKIFLTSPVAGLDGKDLAQPGSFFTRHRESGQPTSVFAGPVYSTGEQRMTALRSIHLASPPMDTPLVATVSRDLESVFAPWRQDAYRQAGLFLLLVLGTTLGLVFYQKRQRNFDRVLAGHAAEQQRNAEQYRSIIHASLDGFWITDTRGGIVDVNESICLMLGYSREELLRMSIKDIEADESSAEIAARIQHMIATGEVQFEARHRRKDGTIIDVEVSVQYVPALGERFFAFVRNVTERKRLEREREQYFRFFQLSIDPMCIADPYGCFEHVNQAFTRLTGFEERELLAKPFLEFILPEDRQRTADEMKQQVELRPSLHFENRYVCKDGRVLLLSWTAYFDRNNGVTYATARDITELRLAEAEILRSNAELEQFSYSISHDMRQPLRMITSYLQLLEKNLADQLDGEKREYFNFAIDGARRLDRMLVALLEYSRIGRLGEPAAWVESRDILDEALLFLRSAVDEAQGRLTVTGDWPRVFVSRDEMLRLIQNLIGNALKFRIAGRTPEITVSSEVVADHWRLSITDNGVGILPEQIGRLFQVFQRLQSRADYEGTGIGLALCRKIAEHHGGHISAESRGEGQGSTFRLELPLHDGEVPSLPKPSSSRTS